MLQAHKCMTLYSNITVVISHVSRPAKQCQRLGCGRLGGNKTAHKDKATPFSGRITLVCIILFWTCEKAGPIKGRRFNLWVEILSRRLSTTFAYHTLYSVATRCRKPWKGARSGRCVNTRALCVKPMQPISSSCPAVYCLHTVRGHQRRTSEGKAVKPYLWWVVPHEIPH